MFESFPFVFHTTPVRRGGDRNIPGDLESIDRNLWARPTRPWNPRYRFEHQLVAADHVQPNAMPIGAAALGEAKTGKGKRALLKRAPKEVEDGKRAILLCGGKASNIVQEALRDFQLLLRGRGQRLTRKNENVKPFEVGGETELEFFAQKNDCSLFLLGSHSKKRPHNLVLGRFFDGHLYDMVEVGIETFTSFYDMKKENKPKPHLGGKPMFAFAGEGFENDPQLKQLRLILLDMFHGENVSKINLKGLDSVLLCTAMEDGRVLFKHCAVVLKKSGTRVPNVKLEEIGPSMTLRVRRAREALPSMAKEAHRVPKGIKPKKVKNVTDDPVMGKRGRLYVPQQDFDSIVYKKMKGMKRERREAAAAASNAKREASPVEG